MRLSEKLLKDLQQAMRDRDAPRRSTLRVLRTVLTNAEIAAESPLSEEEEMQLVATEARQRREIIEEYARAGRQDLVEEAKAELAIIEEYLPRQMTRPEIETLARQAIAELDARDLSQLGEVMRHLMPQLKSQADGRLVNEVVRQLLSTGQSHAS